MPDWRFFLLFSFDPGGFGDWIWYFPMTGGQEDTVVDTGLRWNGFVAIQ
jgi:hypothetical protein